ncbi:hypothetical protein C8R47DRAFT_1147640 [Mycena vitilis]|nr:hypothetical protein C8R47DRAFT_1147640 [Mycena vitilis]
MHRFAALLGSNRPPTEQEGLGIRSLLEELDPQQQDESNLEVQRPRQSCTSELESSTRENILDSLCGALCAMRYLPAEILGQIFIDCRNDSLNHGTKLPTHIMRRLSSLRCALDAAWSRSVLRNCGTMCASSRTHLRTVERYLRRNSSTARATSLSP